MKVEISNGSLVILMPLKHIKYGLENHPYDPIKITDIKAMGEFFKRAIEDETINDGDTTVFEEMLDKIGNIGVENGEEWFELDEDYQ